MRRRTFLRTTFVGALLAAFRLRARQLFAAGRRKMIDDPILGPWVGPHGGFPRFDKFSGAALKPALEQGIEWKRAEILAIASNPAAPTFDNTVAALEGAGPPLSRAQTIYGILRS